jgi:formamidopyrimidine-DNA glycosylase
VPELPEVETVRRSLAPHLVRRRIVGVEVRERRLRVEIAADLPARLSGRRIEALGRRGKYLLAALDDGRIWLVHLGMTGRLILARPGRASLADLGVGRHVHVLVDLEDGQRVVYQDPRRFGRMAVVDPAALDGETGPGVDALAPGLTATALFRLTRRRRTPVKALLMDQRRIAGLGNIYANEILHHAGIRPRRRAGGLRRAECARLSGAVRAVLGAALRRGGSSISDYVDGLGRSGWFQLRHRVYGRGGAPCRRCGAAVRHCVVTGRATYYCPRCQT